MLDHQQRFTVELGRPDPEQQWPEALRSRVATARGGFVETEDAGVEGQEARELRDATVPVESSRMKQFA